MSDKTSRPFPISIEVEFLDRLSEPVRDGRAKSVSAILRAALEQYDFSNMVVMRASQVQISVRLSGDIRKSLKKVSRVKHTSVGQLVRVAVEDYLPKLEAAAAASAKKSQRKKAAAKKATGRKAGTASKSRKAGR
ncbi:MAG: ribbon-helix-helix protein, CopG family [Lacunisphaera sp.]